MSTDLRAKFTNVFNEEKKNLLSEYSDSPDLLERIVYELKDKRSYRVAAHRARTRVFPKNPQSHKDIELHKIGLEAFELGRYSSESGENKDVILLGTRITAEAWARSEFKSGDRTFKICLKEFFQVFVLMALFGGTYLPCMVGLLPDKSYDSYARLFSLVWAYLNSHGLPNTFQNEFFMTDFEVAICGAFKLFWPAITLLGCYFHFSQLIWKRVKKTHLQVEYEKNYEFNALIRRLSSLPFVKPEDLNEAFEIFRKRALNLKSEKVQEFALNLIEYAQTQWRGQFAIQDWNLHDINCLLVPATNNGNESANGRFSGDFGTHPPFWNFCFTLKDELEGKLNLFWP